MELFNDKDKKKFRSRASGLDLIAVVCHHIDELTFINNFGTNLEIALQDQYAYVLEHAIKCVVVATQKFGNAWFMRSILPTLN